MRARTGPVRAVMFTLLPFVVDPVEAQLRERGHKLAGLVAAPGPRSRRSDEFHKVADLARPGLDVIISNYPDRWADMIRPLKPDLIICAGFNWILPTDLLGVAPLGAYNLHDSLLPKNRGRNATGWSLRTGAPGFGVSFHRMTPGLDEGPILAQREVVIADDEDIDDLFIRWFGAMLEAHAEALDRALEGFPGFPQNEDEATYSPGAFEPEWRELDWNKPVRDVFFQLRSWYGVRGVPRGAFGEVDGQRLLITKAKPAKGMVELRDASPGTVLSRSSEEILIQCADFPLRVMKWEDGLAGSDE